MKVYMMKYGEKVGSSCLSLDELLDVCADPLCPMIEIEVEDKHIRSLTSQEIERCKEFQLARINKEKERLENIK